MDDSKFHRLQPASYGSRRQRPKIELSLPPSRGSNLSEKYAKSHAVHSTESQQLTTKDFHK